MSIWERIGLEPADRLLIYGIGNVGRQDDGLGIRIVERLESALPLGTTLESGYQLNVEDALLLSEYDVVLFVDATVEKDTEAPFSIRPVEPSAELAFSTHAMTPSAVLSLCEELYRRRPRAFLLTVPGYEWDIREELSEGARRNLEQACQALMEARHA